MSGMLTMLYKIKIYIQGYYKLLCYLRLLCISFSDIFLSFVYVHFLWPQEVIVNFSQES
jgi:hypothetical protein